MPNGCMCCRVRGDLVDALKRLIVSANGASAGDELAPQQQHQEDGGSTPSLSPDSSKSGITTDSVGADAAGGRSNQVTARTASSGPNGVVQNTATAAAERQPQEVAAKEAVAAAAAAAPTKLDGIILECSGLDELAPVLQVRIPICTIVSNGLNSC